MVKNVLEDRNSDILTGFGQNSQLLWPKLAKFWPDFGLPELTRPFNKMDIDGLKIELQGQTRAENDALDEAHLMQRLEIDLDYFFDSKKPYLWL